MRTNLPLSYKRTQVRLFSTLILKRFRVPSSFVYLESAARKKGIRDGARIQTTDRGMIELEGMIDYCTKPNCRRKVVLEHFGEQFDASTQCQKTCDYCINPVKVKSETQAAECMSAVVNSQRIMRSNNRSRDEAQPFHHNPIDSDESQHDGYESDGFLGADDELDITGYARDDCFATKSSDAPTTNGFVKASSILGKFQVSALAFFDVRVYMFCAQS